MKGFTDLDLGTVFACKILVANLIKFSVFDTLVTV